jgi:hypothetical protein
VIVFDCELDALNNRTLAFCANLLGPLEGNKRKLKIV